MNGQGKNTRNSSGKINSKSNGAKNYKIYDCSDYYYTISAYKNNYERMTEELNNIGNLPIIIDDERITNKHDGERITNKHDDERITNECSSSERLINKYNGEIKCISTSDNVYDHDNNNYIWWISYIFIAFTFTVIILVFYVLGKIENEHMQFFWWWLTLLTLCVIALYSLSSISNGFIPSILHDSNTLMANANTLMANGSNTLMANANTLMANGSNTLMANANTLMPNGSNTLITNRLNNTMSNKLRYTIIFFHFYIFIMCCVVLAIYILIAMECIKIDLVFATCGIILISCHALVFFGFVFKLISSIIN